MAKAEPRKFLRTMMLRIYRPDWPAVKAGTKTEFRKPMPGWGAAVHLELPTPVYLYSTNMARQPEGMMAIMEESRIEPLMAITPESLGREGFANIDEFKRYWMLRYDNQRIRPLQKVRVFRVSAFDRDRAGHLLLDRLFGHLL
jgi:hypothetical protein